MSAQLHDVVMLSCHLHYLKEKYSLILYRYPIARGVHTKDGGEEAEGKSGSEEDETEQKAKEENTNEPGNITEEPAVSDVSVVEEDEETVGATTDEADVAEAGNENATEKGVQSDYKEDVKGEDDTAQDGEVYFYYGDGNDDHKNQDYQDDGIYYYDDDDSNDSPEDKDYNDESDYEHDEEDEGDQKEEFNKNGFKSKTVGKNTIPGKL